MLIGTRVADAHHFIANPDLSFPFNVDPDPTFHLNANPDPATQQRYGNQQPLVYTTLQDSLLSIHASIVSLHVSIVSVHGSPLCYFEPLKL